VDVTTATLLGRAATVRRTSNVHVGRLLLTLLALLPFALGWAVGAVVTALEWFWSLVVVGWQSARRDGEDVPG
jgi:hypothetical protein